MNLAKMMTTTTVRLSLFGLITALLLGLTFELTESQIIEQQRRAELRIYDELVPSDSYDNDLLTSTFNLSPQMIEITHSDSEARVAKNGDEIVAVIFRSDALDGYSGRISMVVAVDSAGQLIGVRVVSHSETPGLGDKIDIRKSDWITTLSDAVFEPTNMSSWYVKKDGGQFDQFTGATITPRAVVGQVRATLDFINTNPNWLKGVK